MFKISIRRVLPAALVLPSAFGTSGSAQTWTEARVMEVFAQHSPRALAARAQIAVARAEARGRALYSNPSFGYSREGAGFTEFFQVEQVLPVTGRVRFLRQSIAPAVGAAEADAEAQILQLRSEVRLAFYQLLAAQSRQEILKATAQDLQQVIGVLAAREKEGEGTRFDRLRWERELIDIRAEVASLQAQSVQAKTRLLEFLPQGTEIARVEGNIVPPDGLPALGALLDRALAARPEIRAANQLIARFRLEQQAAERLRYPEPVLAGGLKRAQVTDLSGRTPAERTQNGLFAGITIPIPAFSRGQTEVVRLQAEQARMEAQRRAVEHEIRAQVNGAYATLRLRREALDSYRKELGARNEELLTMARTAYQEGAAGILELLDVFRLQRQSQQRVVELEAAVREAQIELDRALGREVTK